MIEYFLIVVGIMFISICYSLWKKRKDIKENFQIYKNMMETMQKAKKP